MSQTYTTAFIQQYQDNMMLLFQQGVSQFRGKVREQAAKGTRTYFDFLGPTSMFARPGRHAPTQYVDSQHSRRYGNMSDWVWADLVDDVDTIRALIEPTSAYVQNAAMAGNRKIDELIVAAMDASANTGVDGSTPVAFPTSTNQIVDGGTGMTVSKFRTLKLTMDTAEVDPGSRNFAISPTGIQDLLEDPQVTSADFNTVQALVQGTLNTYMGFDIFQTNRLDVAANIRKCWGWHTMSMGLLVGQNPMSRISEMPDLNYSTQVYFKLTMGAVRLIDEGVYQVDIDESV